MKPKLIGTLIIVGLLCVGFEVYSSIRNGFPSRSDTIDSIEIFTKAPLPENLDILWSRADLINFSTRASKMCALIRLNSEDYDQFLSSMVSDPIFLGDRADFRCPNARKAEELSRQYKLDFEGIGGFTHHAGYAVYTNAAEKVILLNLQVF